MDLSQGDNTIAIFKVIFYGNVSNFEPPCLRKKLERMLYSSLPSETVFPTHCYPTKNPENLFHFYWLPLQTKEKEKRNTFEG